MDFTNLLTTKANTMIDYSKLEFNESEILILNEFNVVTLLEYCIENSALKKQRLDEVWPLVLQLMLQVNLKARRGECNSIDDLCFNADGKQWTNDPFMVDHLIILANGRIYIEVRPSDEHPLTIKMKF